MIKSDGRVLRLVSRDMDPGLIFRENLKIIQDNKPVTIRDGIEAYRKGGESIRAVRERLNLTRKEFGQLFGFSETIVGKWERAESRPRGHALNSMKFLLERAGFKQYADMIRVEDFGYNIEGSNNTQV